MQRAAALCDSSGRRAAERTDPPDLWRFRVAGPRRRRRIRRFIATAFAQAYGARLNTFMPELAALYRSGVMVAACGLRRAADERLYLERYFDEPIECVLVRSVDTTVRRSDIVEVGNLAIAKAGAARALIAHLTDHLLSLGIPYVVFTAVPALRNSFARLGVPLQSLGAARADRLDPHAREEWGTYYEQRPVVMCVAVAAAAQALESAQ